MTGVPTPLQIGSPVTSRRQSEHAVPSTLRIGSPTTGGTPPSHARPPLARKNTSGASDRLSQLFPSRPSSVASPQSPSNTSATRRQSFPSPLISAVEHPYRIPPAPAPPAPRPHAFGEETSYNPVASVFFQDRASPSLDKSNSRTRRVLNRLASLNKGSSRGGSYNRLDDEETAPLGRSLKDVAEGDEVVGYDLTSLGGLPMKRIEAQSVQTEAAFRARELNEASHAADFETLEAQLGAGMTSVLQKPFTHTPSGPTTGYFPGHRRILSAADVADDQAKKAQVEAEKTGQVIAVAADVPVDISDFEGVARDFESMSSLVRKEAQTSYFFPEGETADTTLEVFDLILLQIHRCRAGVPLP